MSMTLGESLALAYSKGDRAAIYALMDLLNEERDRDGSLNDKARENRLNYQSSGRTPNHTGYDVYHWPEFMALARRLGILYDQFTIDLTIKLPVEGFVEVIQSYRGVDQGPVGNPTGGTGNG